MFEPARTPQAAVGQLDPWVMAARKVPTIRKRLAVCGAYGVCGTDFAKQSRGKCDEYANSIQETAIKGE